MTGVDLAMKAHMKSLGEHNVKLDVESIEEKPFETLDAKKTGIVSVCVFRSNSACLGYFDTLIFLL
jgi:hypothetical protein